MKKILITLSVTILCLGLSACGNKETDKSKNQVTVSSSKETEKNQGSNIQEEELRDSQGRIDLKKLVSIVLLFSLCFI